MNTGYREALLKAPKKNRYNLVQLYQRGHVNHDENMSALIKSKNDVENAILLLIQPEEDKQE
jgi:hypothetical protein